MKRKILYEMCSPDTQVMLPKIQNRSLLTIPETIEKLSLLCFVCILCNYSNLSSLDRCLSSSQLRSDLISSSNFLSSLHAHSATTGFL